MLAAAAMGLACLGAVALPAPYSMSQLYHTQWTVHDGVPSSIEAIAQTGDGFLWLGTSGGLFRFDGVEFERFTGSNGVPLLSPDIFSLHASEDGSLWVGHHLGGVSHLRHGHLVNYGKAEGLPPSSVTALAQDGDGTVWAGTTRGLYRLEHGQWQQAGPAWAVPSSPVDAMVLDRDRTLWVMGSETLYFLRPGSNRFERLAADVHISNYSTLLRRPDGTAAVCSSGRVRTLALNLLAAGGGVAPAWTDQGFDMSVDTRCVVDRDGHLWIGGIEGVTRITVRTEATSADPARRKPHFAPLSGESVSSALEDREGNIWFATRAGLDRFRAPALLKLPLDAGSNEFALAPAGADGVWIGTSKGNVFRATSAATEQIRFGHLPHAGIDALSTAASGALWVAGGDSLWRRRPDGGWQQLPRRAGAGAPGGYTYSNIEAVTQDASGALWVSVLRVGVYRVVGDTWTLWGGRTDLPTHNATALFTDAQGRIWFGYDDGVVNRLDGDRLTTVVSEKGPVRPEALGAVAAFAQRGAQVWVGGEKGLWCVEGSEVQAVTGHHGAFIGVSGIASAPAGDLWLSTAEGVVHLPAAELQRPPGSPAQAVRGELLNHLDGLPGLPKAAVASGGRIWFATVNGVVWTDPARTPRNTITPGVTVKSITADGASYGFGSGAPVELPVRTRDLKITYTSPSLTMPERVAFRYRLGDERAEWQDVGTRREAYFRDLPPGRYRFQVMAANNDGVWNDAGTAISFVIPPTFVQTGWFTAVCVVAGAAALWLLYLLRLRSVKERLRLRLEERMVERERIARELHDTFLQAVQGLVLRFHAAMGEMSPDEPSHGLMRNALDQADEVIADGRDAVTNLRVASELPSVFTQHLRAFGERWSQDTGMPFAMSVEGAAGTLDPVAVQECERIVTEALSNAFRHAQGTCVRLDITFAPRHLTLQVTDDGRGFNPDPPHAGRWGLVGMRERAERLHGRLRVDSGRAGTAVTLEVPGRIAYRRGSRRWTDRLLRTARRAGRRIRT